MHFVTAVCDGCPGVPRGGPWARASARRPAPGTGPLRPEPGPSLPPPHRRPPTLVGGGGGEGGPSGPQVLVAGTRGARPPSKGRERGGTPHTRRVGWAATLLSPPWGSVVSGSTTEQQRCSCGKAEAAGEKREPLGKAPRTARERGNLVARKAPMNGESCGAEESPDWAGERGTSSRKVVHGVRP